MIADIEADVETIGQDIDAVDEELGDARLLGREQFVPERIEAPEGLADLGLNEGFLVSHEELRTVQD